ncbi:MAG: ABC transporter substrate-binding protein [Anaerolineae bacterium]
MKNVTNVVKIAILLALLLALMPAQHTFAQGGVACEEDVTVQADDWLSKLADKFYGDPLAFPAIAAATNAAAADDSSYATIGNVNIIEIGWKLCIPSAADAQVLLDTTAGGLLAQTADLTCNTSHVGERLVFYQQAGITGPLAAITGPGLINGSQDAIKAINDAGGICGATVEVVLTDTQYDPEQELATYEIYRDSDPRPMFVLTYASAASIVLKDRVVEDKIVNIAAGLNGPAFYDPPNGYTFGVAPIYSDQFAGFLKWAQDNWDTIKPEGAGDDIVVGVIGWDNAFGTGATTDEALAYAESIGVTVLPVELMALSPTADPTGQIQNLQLQGANIIYNQSLAFTPAAVISTIRALGLWDQFIVGGVNWSMDNSMLGFLGENAELAEGYYAVFPYLYWDDTDQPAVRAAQASFDAGGYPPADHGVGYLLSYGAMDAARQITIHAINRDGFENLSGETFFNAMVDLGTINAAGMYQLEASNGRRAPNRTQIRQVQIVDGQPQFVSVSDWFELPDTRPTPSQ